MTLPLSPSHRDSFLMYLVYMYIFSTSLLVFLINSCSGEFPGDPAITMSPPSAGRAGSVLIRDLRLHMPLGQKTQKTWKRNNIVTKFTAAAAKSLQSCPTLCDLMDCSPPGSSVHWYRSGLTCAPPGGLPNPRIKPASLTATALQADALLVSHPGSPTYLHTQLSDWTEL